MVTPGEKRDALHMLRLFREAVAGQDGKELQSCDADVRLPSAWLDAVSILEDKIPLLGVQNERGA